MLTATERKRADIQRDQERQRRIQEDKAAQSHVIEGDLIGDVVDDYPDFILFFILIYRFFRNAWRKFVRSVRDACSKQADEEVMAMLQRENESFILTHMGANIDHVQFIEPLEAKFIADEDDAHFGFEDTGVGGIGGGAGDVDTEGKVVMFHLPKIEEGYSKFKRWILQVAKTCNTCRGDEFRDQWIKGLWERWNIQVEEKDVKEFLIDYVKKSGKLYSLEELEEDYSKEEIFMMESELRMRILHVCEKKMEGYEELVGGEKKVVWERDLGMMGGEIDRLKMLEKDLKKGITDQKRRYEILRKQDPTYKKGK